MDWGDIVVKHWPELNFDGLRPAPDRVWFGKMTFEVAQDEWQVEQFLRLEPFKASKGIFWVFWVNFLLILLTFSYIWYIIYVYLYVFSRLSPF